jgi:monoamine oxidase
MSRNGEKLFTNFNRRHFLVASSGLLLNACDSHNQTSLSGNFLGPNFKVGHQLRNTLHWPAPTQFKKSAHLVLGAGIAGLAACRSLDQKNQDDYYLIELESNAGGNSQATTMHGIDCPLGAHYLPTPSNEAPEVLEFLGQIKLGQYQQGKWVWDEQYLCHSPQERLYYQNEWHYGLLPPAPPNSYLQQQYLKFAKLIQSAMQERWAIPSYQASWGPIQKGLVAFTMAQYLQKNDINAPELIWFLNYCCLDEYGAGIDHVSAWAGIHYFAARHGFYAPGEESTSPQEAVLTWPKGNAFLSGALSSKLKDRFKGQELIIKINELKNEVEVDTFNIRSQVVTRWTCKNCIVALPINVAQKVVAQPIAFLKQAAQLTQYSAWLVANLYLPSPLSEKSNVQLSWDNVIYEDIGLGYVSAKHQNLAMPRKNENNILTYYWALGSSPKNKQLLLEGSWHSLAQQILNQIAIAHPDIRAKCTELFITRYGHAMAVPHINNSLFLQSLPLVPKTKRIAFAHSDWAGYSIFEEAFVRGFASV